MALHELCIYTSVENPSRFVCDREASAVVSYERGIEMSGVPGIGSMGACSIPCYIGEHISCNCRYESWICGCDCHNGHEPSIISNMVIIRAEDHVIARQGTEKGIYKKR